MAQTNQINLNEIKKIYKSNYSKVLHEFISVQSDFLSDVYKRYDKDLDAANIVLYFAKNLHKSTLRERDKDLDFNISFENFWDNHQKTTQDKRKIIEIAQSTGLPKETARRKVNNLLKNKVLQKEKNFIYWSPPNEQRKTYNKVVERQINQISKLVQMISVLLNLKISKDKINTEVKKYFSFFWYHYLNTQLKYLKMWLKELNDLELILIAMQCVIQTTESLKDKNASSYDYFISGNIQSKKIQRDPSISATSVSEITGVPRATCIRKLDKLHKMKVVKKDNNSKRYHLDLKNLGSNAINTRRITEDTIDMFSEFYLIVLKALSR